MSVFEESEFSWLPLPDVADRLGITASQVRRLVEENRLAGIRRDGIFMIPEFFLSDSEPLAVLRGTLTLLLDVGFSRDDAVRWLLTGNDALGSTPIAAMIAGRKTEVRRIAQALA